MWRRLLAIVVCALALAAGGCGRPPGVDGSLIDDWPAFPVPRFPDPQVGWCTDDPGVASMLSMSRFHPLPRVDCGVRHLGEVVYVGHFTGAAAAADTSPVDGTGAERAAYGDCERGADAFLGGDWHDARVELRYYVPTPTEWATGSRYFRCELFQVVSPEYMLVPRTGSLRGGLRGAGPLRFGCAVLKNPAGTWTEPNDVTPVGCAIPHDAEYVATIRLDLTDPPTDEQLIHSGGARCQPKILSFLAVTAAQWSREGTIGTLYWPPAALDWVAGDRGIRCWITIYHGRKATSSLRGAGPDHLP